MGGYPRTGGENQQHLDLEREEQIKKIEEFQNQPRERKNYDSKRNEDYRTGGSD